MTEERFLRELEQALNGRMTPTEVSEIIADHAEFFTAGRADGRTEDEIAARLGAPAQIAATLLGEPEVSPTQAPTDEAVPAPAKAATYRRVLAFAVDLLFMTLPFVWLSPRVALLSFFTPQRIPLFLSSFWSTVKVSNHAWIAAVRPLWSTGIILTGFWFFGIIPLLLMLWQGQTPGKRLFGLRVVSLNGAPANSAQLVARELFGKLALNTLCGVIWLPLAFVPPLISLIWNLFSPEGNTLWDAIARTKVVEVAAAKLEN